MIPSNEFVVHKAAKKNRSQAHIFSVTPEAGISKTNGLFARSYRKAENPKTQSWSLLPLVLAFLVALMSLTMFGCSKKQSYDGLSFVVAANGYRVQASTTIEGKLSIPSTYKGKPVVEIAAEGFSGQDKLTSVKLPKQLTFIGNSAFKGCTALTEIVLPKNLTKIDISAFEKCANLVDIKVLSSDVIVESAALDGTRWLDQQEEGLVYIGNTLYTHKGELSKGYQLAVREGATQIASYAFKDQLGLTSISIPASIIRIGTGAFSGCSFLSDITTENSQITIGAAAFMGTQWLKDQTEDYVYLGKTLYIYNGSSSAGATINKIKEDTAKIAAGAFMLRTDIKSVVVPQSVTDIGEMAFSYCISLESVELPSGLATINDNLFNNCTSLKSIMLSSGLKSIGKSAFNNCTSLANISIPSTITAIEDNAFRNCKALLSISITAGVKTICDYAFVNCTSLKSVIISSTVTSIGSGVFGGCSALESISVDKNSKTFREDSGCLIRQSDNALIAGCRRSIIPSTVKSIGDGAFYDIDTITSISLPKKLTSIGKEAFFSCGGLSSITIPSSVSVIGQDAFKECYKLSINAEADQKPDGWHESWNSSARPVTWGYVIEL